MFWSFHECYNFFRLSIFEISFRLNLLESTILLSTNIMYYIFNIIYFKNIIYFIYYLLIILFILLWANVYKASIAGTSMTEF